MRYACLDVFIETHDVEPPDVDAVATVAVDLLDMAVLIALPARPSIALGRGRSPAGPLAANAVTFPKSRTINCGLETLLALAKLVTGAQKAHR